MARIVKNSTGARPLLAVLCAIVLAQFANPAPAQERKVAGQEDAAAAAAAAAAAEKKKKAQEADEAYKASLKRIPDKPKPDPWGGMRSK